MEQFNLERISGGLQLQNKAALSFVQLQEVFSSLFSPVQIPAAETTAQHALIPTDNLSIMKKTSYPECQIPKPRTTPDPPVGACLPITDAQITFWFLLFQK